MKKTLIIISIIITILVYNKENDKILIPKNSIRIRVIANSNNIEDQVLKLKVKEKVESKLYEKLDNTKDINVARNKIKSTLPEILFISSKSEILSRYGGLDTIIVSLILKPGNASLNHSMTVSCLANRAS